MLLNCSLPIHCVGLMCWPVSDLVLPSFFSLVRSGKYIVILCFSPSLFHFLFFAKAPVLSLSSLYVSPSLPSTVCYFLVWCSLEKALPPSLSSWSTPPPPFLSLTHPLIRPSASSLLTAFMWSDDCWVTPEETSSPSPIHDDMRWPCSHQHTCTHSVKLPVLIYCIINILTHIHRTMTVNKQVLENTELHTEPNMYVCTHTHPVPTHINTHTERETHTHTAITPILQGHMSNRLEQMLAVCFILGMS